MFIGLKENAPDIRVHFLLNRTCFSLFLSIASK